VTQNQKISLFSIFILSGMGLGIYFFLKPGKINRSDLTISHYKKNEASSLPNEERAKIFELHRACFEEVRRNKLLKFLKEREQTWTPEIEKRLTTRVDQIIEDGKKQGGQFLEGAQNLYLARIRDQIVGLFTCSDDITYTYAGVMIYNVCVDPTLQGRGIGKAMMIHGIESCQKPERALALTVYKDQTPTIGLYQSLGFVIKDPVLQPPKGGFDFFDKYFMIFNKEGSEPASDP
jgi:ribosomal protein S18 acetylase RimI-like enzyme